MSKETGQLIELVRRSLEQEATGVFRDRVDEEGEWLKEAIETGVLDNADFTIGFEMEVYAITDTDEGAAIQETAPESEMSPSAIDSDGAELARVPEVVFEPSAVNKELGMHNVEINTDPTVLNESGLAAQAAQIHDRLQTARAAAQDANLEIVADAMWTLPPDEGAIEYLSAVESHDEFVVAENMRKDPRYIALDNHILAYTQENRIPFSVTGVDMGFPTILFESLATSIQPHLQIPEAAAFPTYFNTAIRTLGPVLALASNSPFLPPAMYDDVGDPERLIRETDHELRIAVFEQSVNQTAHPKVRVPPDIETTTDVVDRVLADDRYAPFLREWIEDDAERESLSDRIWEFDYKRTTYWRWIRCVLGGDSVDSDNDEYSLRIEYRPIPTQPTVTDVVGFQALVSGLILGLVEAEHPIVDLPWEAAESSFYRAATSGLDAELEWVTAQGERTSDREVIFSELFTYAKRGLETAGITTEDAEAYLSPIEARWNANTTPSIWKKRRVAKALEDGADLETAIYDMQEEYIHRSRNADSFADWL